MSHRDTECHTMAQPKKRLFKTRPSQFVLHETKRHGMETLSGKESRPTKRLLLRRFQGGADFFEQLIDFERFEENGGEAFAAGADDRVVGIVTETRR